MRVTLLHGPRVGRIPNFFPPLGLATLAGHLKECGHTVTCNDLDIWLFKSGNSSVRDLLERVDLLWKFIANDEESIREFVEYMLKPVRLDGTDVFGISVPQNLECLNMTTLALAKQIKERTAAPIVVGGEVEPWQHLYERADYIDYVVLPGEGEQPFNQLLSQLEAGKDAPLEKFISPFTRRIHDAPLTVTDDGFPRPDFSVFPLEDYRYRYLIEGAPRKRTLLLPYRFVKNCPMSCAFCCCSQSPYCLAYSPHKVAEDLEFFKKKFRTRHFLFLNTNANVSIPYIRALANELKDRDIKWNDDMNFVSISPQILKELREAGLTMGLFGLESASPRMLTYLRKRVSVSDAEKTIRKANEEGVWVELMVIAGFPYESEEDLQQTMSFIRKNDPYISVFHHHRFRLIPSDMLNYPAKYGLRVRGSMHDLGSPDGYPFDEVEGLSWEEKRGQMESYALRVAELIPPHKTLHVPVELKSVLYACLHPREHREEYAHICGTYMRSPEQEKLIDIGT